MNTAEPDWPVAGGYTALARLIRALRAGYSLIGHPDSISGTGTCPCAGLCMSHNRHSGRSKGRYAALAQSLARLPFEDPRAKRVFAPDTGFAGVGLLQGKRVNQVKGDLDLLRGCLFTGFDVIHQQIDGFRPDAMFILPDVGETVSPEWFCSGIE